MGLSSLDISEIRNIKQSVLGGRLNAGNPGFQVYSNTGGHVSTRLPPAPTGQTYYEYQVGAAVAPAAGFAAGAGVAGVKRLVLLISESQASEITGNRVCYVNPGPPPIAVGLPFSADYQTLLELRNKKKPDFGEALARPLNEADQVASNFLAPLAGEELRKIRQHKFPAKRYPAAAGLPAAGGTKDLYFKRRIETKYTIHKAYFSDDHYQSFSNVDY